MPTHKIRLLVDKDEIIAAPVLVTPYPVLANTELFREFTFLMCLAADDFAGIAGSLREGATRGAGRGLLADKIEGRRGRPAAYTWKKRNGRPNKLSLADDPLRSAMETGNLAFIADHLRTAARLDRQLLDWLADQFDPHAASASRFVLRKRQKRELRSKKRLELLRLGRIVVREFRGPGHFEAALSRVTTKSAEVPNPVSRATAIRAYNAVKQQSSGMIRFVIPDLHFDLVSAGPCRAQETPKRN